MGLTELFKTKAKEWGKDLSDLADKLPKDAEELKQAAKESVHSIKTGVTNMGKSVALEATYATMHRHLFERLGQYKAENGTLEQKADNYTVTGTTTDENKVHRISTTETLVLEITTPVQDSLLNYQTLSAEIRKDLGHLVRSLGDNEEFSQTTTVHIEGTEFERKTTYTQEQLTVNYQQANLLSIYFAKKL